ncbi:unnamed protein product [Cochlearia groenlandica]
MWLSKTSTTLPLSPFPPFPLPPLPSFPPFPPLPFPPPLFLPVLLNSSAAKRARTDGGRREDDWTCPSCGNVNFSFRTTCNMRNCTQSRPADHIGKSAPRPMQHPHSFSSPGPYIGSGGGPSVYMGGSPYGSSLFNGSSMPPYDVPFSGGSPYHFNYNSRVPAGAHYRPFHMSGPPPYHGGSMMGSGGMYGMPPPMDRYGLGMAMGPAAAMMPRPGYFTEEKSQRRDSTRDNDWTCPNCGNVNFSFRTVCNMRKCNTPKPGPQLGGSSDKISKHNPPEGSWKCDNCGNINYPFRNKCNRQNCGADKPGHQSNDSPSHSSEEKDQVSVKSNVSSGRPMWQRVVEFASVHFTSLLPISWVVVLY